MAVERLKKRIYATVTMVAVLMGLRQIPHLEPADAALAIAGTAVGLWLASLVADAQAHRTVHGQWARTGEIRRMLYVATPLLLSGAGPLLLAGLSSAGTMELPTALAVAVTTDVFSLFLWGWLGGLCTGAGPVTALITGGLDAAIGLGVVAVKALATH
ncbi:hypothetical protein [Streptomyces sp. NPDC096311]|uniref:hypothetical protein n=1 Tax=Streptomyces sp. NPDC096311 TaxID=3366083 RepID=UPI00380324A7